MNQVNSNLVIGLNNIPSSFRNKWISSRSELNYFSTYEWFEVFSKSITRNSNDELLICLTDHSENPIGVLPLWRTNIGHLKIIRSVRSMSNYYSCYYLPVFFDPSPSKTEMIDLLPLAIDRHLTNWDALDLLPLPSDAESFETLKASLKKQFNYVKPYFCFGNWRYDLNGQSFYDYFKGRPSRLRNTFKRKIKKLRASGKPRFVIHEDDSEELNNAIEQYNLIYKARWRKEEPYPDFIPLFIKQLAKHGKLRLGFLYMNNKPLATQLWFKHNDTAYIYKLAHHPEYEKYSIGTLLSTMMFEYAIDNDKVSLIDYLSGDDIYKKQWMNERREMWGIQISNRRSISGNILGLHNSLNDLLRKK